MSYMHIDNLYKNQDILLFKECYAMEKIHGTSAHVSWKKEEGINLFPGGVDYDSFKKLFDLEKLTESFQHLGVDGIVVFGEAYGGKIQGMRETYGNQLRFVAFEVKIGKSWLCVPDAKEVAVGLGFDFVPFKLIQTTLNDVDAARDEDSVQAVKTGCGFGKMREGVVLRPPIEVIKNNGARIIAKHKRIEFSETATPRKISEISEKLKDANAIAVEWVTDMRLTHVLDEFQSPTIEDTGNVIKAMIADVVREAGDAILDSREARVAIGKRCAVLYKNRLRGGM